MERYCKRLSSIILSPRNPWPSIDEYILVTTQANIVSLCYLPLAGHSSLEFEDRNHCMSLR
jgi:hypothetical protein